MGTPKATEGRAGQKHLFSLTVVDARAGGKEKKNRLVFSSLNEKDLGEWRAAFKKVWSLSHTRMLSI